MDFLSSSCRVAFAALAHDLGKFAQRADLPASADERNAHIQLYCPKAADGRHTHIHAAYTGLFFKTIEAWAPALTGGDQTPFEGADSLVNAASAHHAPVTLLQQVVAAADRAASGFEREQRPPEAAAGSDQSYIAARQWPLFEEIRLDSPSPINPIFRKPLLPLSVRALFPVKAEKPLPTAEAREEYRRLWSSFEKAGAQMPKPLRGSWPLWLDAFDTLWLAFTQAIPSATAFGAKPDVSLYDHSKAAAAFAPAIWRWCLASGLSDEALSEGLKRRTLWDEESILLIQGDFFGIQNFIFSGADGTDAKAAKILRGRSFYVSLLTEACALRVLEALALPATSQIMNAAGKFLIVAPNTPDVVQKLSAVRREVTEWFVKHTCAEAGIGIAVQSARLNDFTAKNFPQLMKSIFATLEREKLQRFDLFGDAAVPAVLDADYSQGACAWQGRWPADGTYSGESTCAVTRDQIRIGEALVRSDLIVLVDAAHEDAEPCLAKLADKADVLELPLFGYKALFSQRSEIESRLRSLPIEAVRRIWDFSMPEAVDEVLWKGFARRSFNGYVPRLSASFSPEADLRFRQAPMDEIGRSRILPFSWIARCDLSFDKDGSQLGLPALCVLKGDIDQLGRIFQEGLSDGPNAARRPDALRSMTFAKMATLSREVNAFFTTVVPQLCSAKFPSIYTVFAGGDDFCFIGPQHSAQRFADALRKLFADYATHNPEVHFSAGMTIAKPGMPVRRLAAMAEDALSAAKASGRNAFSIYGQCLPWTQWDRLADIEDGLERSAELYGLSTSYLYALFELIDLAARTDDPRASIWRSRLFYATRRAMDAARRHGSTADPKQASLELIGFLSRAIDEHREAMRIPLSNLFYRMRRPKQQSR